MAHIILDGVTVAVNQLDEESMEVGNRQRSFGGSMLVSRQATKRVWSGQTPPLPPTEADMVAGIIQGAGQNWSIERGGIYTTKGTSPIASTSAAVMGLYGADGDIVVDEYTDSPVKYGSYALSHYNPAIENLLPADTRDAEGTTGDYTVSGAAVLAMDTSNYWEQTKSVKCTLAAAGFSGIRASTTTATGALNDVFQGTVYIKAAVAGTVVSVYLRDATNAVNGSTINKTLTNANTWYRVNATITLGAAATDLDILIFRSSSGSEVFYCDGWQIEESEKAGPWYGAGAGGTPPALSLYYDYGIVRKSYDTSIAGWVYMPEQDYAAVTARSIMSLVNSSGNNAIFEAYRAPSTNVGLVFRTALDDSPATLHLLSYGASTIWNGGWHHIACVMSHNPDSGRFNKELYFDGAQVGTANTANLPKFVTSTAGEVSPLNKSLSGLFPMYGTVDQLRLLPYALTEAAVASLYASTVGVGETPIITASGDGISPVSASVIGRVTGMSQVKAAVGFRKSVSFDLREV